jgi:hypothetical protein
MKLVLVNTPDLSIIEPAPKCQNKYLSFIIPADSVATIAIVPTVDPNMLVDGMNVVTQLSITIAGKVGDSAYTDKIIMTGESVFTTENNTSLILKDQIKMGAAESSVQIISCGQTSTFAE